MWTEARLHDGEKIKGSQLLPQSCIFVLAILCLFISTPAFSADDYAAPSVATPTCGAATINTSQGGSTAVGCNSVVNDGGTAFGAYTNANGVGTTAVGGGANATANWGTAVGNTAKAGWRAEAFGQDSQATGNGAIAIGTFTRSAGTNSTAIGWSSSTAGFDNSTALGANATNTASNQMMFGTSTTTYTASGITSAASRAAQSGATQFVSTDANGNLAGSGFGPQDIASLQSSVSGLQQGQAILGQTVYSQGNRINANQNEARQGIAMAAAMSQAPMPSAPGKTSWKLNNAIYKNAAASSISIAHRLPTKVPVAVTAGVAIGLRNSAIVTGGLQGEF